MPSWRDNHLYHANRKCDFKRDDDSSYNLKDGRVRAHITRQDFSWYVFLIPSLCKIVRAYCSVFLNFRESELHGSKTLVITYFLITVVVSIYTTTENQTEAELVFVLSNLTCCMGVTSVTIL